MEKKIKILLVDDDVATRGMYAEVFEAEGFQVVEANDGVEGLDLASKENPDLVFTGIIMPRMDGFSLMEALQKSVATANIPVIISSHMGREEDQQRANKLGAKDFIVRDLVTPNKVVKKIKALFSQGGVYRLEFNPFSLDAQKLNRDFGLNSNFQCLECNEKMILRLTSLDTKDRSFETKFVCPNCGWEAK